MDTETGHARGSEFLLLGQAGPTRPGRAAAASGQRSLPLRSASAPDGWRARRWTWSWTSSWLRPGQEGADCAEPPPQRQARWSSRSRQPLRGTVVKQWYDAGEWVNLRRGWRDRE
jgi:hypothetical protein